MKWSVLQIFAVFAFICVLRAEEADIPEEVDDFDGLDAMRRQEQKHLEADLQRERELGQRIAADIAMERNNVFPSPLQEIDPCTKVHCGAGKICVATEETAKCICIPECPQESNPRRRVCTNKNETWQSDCEVYRQRCLCDTNESGCRGPAFKHIHIDYYGECKQLPECSDEEMNDFPRRMRDWLFNVMRDLAERNELTEHYMQMELEAETNHTRRWTNAAIWKWCDLDGAPHDRSVSRHELFPIRAPLVTLEHCIAPFLESCDQDNDHRITLKEWGKCLELDEDEMLEQCDQITET